MPVVRLFVTNLSYEAVDEDLRDLFKKIGKPTIINIMKDRKTGNPRGFAFVTLDTLEEPVDCWRSTIQGEMIRGRPVHIDFAIPKGKPIAGDAGGNH
jgi:cold-inducible RNA-binding protein